MVKINSEEDQARALLDWYKTKLDNSWKIAKEDDREASRMFFYRSLLILCSRRFG